MNYKHFKLKFRVFKTGYTVGMVTRYILNETISCLPMTGHLFDAIIVTLI